MGRGTSGALAAPGYDGAGSPAESDQNLVARIRRGDDRAFELLYQRYHHRIHLYVLGMVKDHGRAEDVTQEVFVSALRRMRETEQPLALKPWLYQIAKNSCIDAFRRSRRAEEISYDTEEGFAPGDHSRLVSHGPSPDAALAAKQDLDCLCGAFGGLSETHHEILVLRELEGLSYAEIGRRMGMSRPAVESTLFRARRRLTDEFDDIVSGARCLRIQAIIATAAQTRLGARDTRRLARHLSHCQPCRREALAAGLDSGLFTRPRVRERIAARVAGFLPLPAFLRLRRGSEAAAAAPPPGGRGASLAAHLPLVSEQLTSGWSKAAAGVALLIAGVGAGVGVHEARTPSAPPPPKSAHVQPAKAATRASEPARAVTTTRTAADAAEEPAKGTSKKPRAKRDRGARRSAGADSPSAADRATSDGGGPAQNAATNQTVATGSGGGSGSATASGGASGGKGTPAISAPVSKPDVDDAIKQTTETARDTTQQTTETARDTTQQTTEAAGGAVAGVTGGGPVSDTVEQVGSTVNEAVGDATQTVDDAAESVTNTINGITGSGG